MATLQLFVNVNPKKVYFFDKFKKALLIQYCLCQFNTNFVQIPLQLMQTSLVSTVVFVVQRLQVRAQVLSGKESTVKQLPNFSNEFAHSGDP